jgi:osmotically-inducible protein OsmY
MINKLLAAAMAAMLFAGLCLAADKKASDDLIRDRVMLRVGSDPDAKVGDLGVEMKDGTATLTGVVETPSQRDKAAKLARKVKGVKQVVNNIRLRDSKAGAAK